MIRWTRVPLLSLSPAAAGQAYIATRYSIVPSAFEHYRLLVSPRWNNRSWGRGAGASLRALPLEIGRLSMDFRT
jgi:hypothetical protein